MRYFTKYIISFRGVVQTKAKDSNKEYLEGKSAR